jgi:hypothetical protein
MHAIMSRPSQDGVRQHLWCAAGKRSCARSRSYLFVVFFFILLHYSPAVDQKTITGSNTQQQGKGKGMHRPSSSGSGVAIMQ